MIIRDKQNLILAIIELQKSQLWSFDIETDGLSCRKNDLIGFGCASPETMEGFYIIMKEWVDGRLVTVLDYSDVKPIIELLSTKTLIGWNFQFDASFVLNKFNINLMTQLHCDVMLAVHACDENKFNYGLKQISTELFGKDSVNEQDEMKESIKHNGGSANEYYKADSALMALYGIQDNILTCKNYLYWTKELERQGLTQFFQVEYMDMYREVVFDMCYKGIPVDVEALKTTLSEISFDMDSIERSIQDQIAPHLDLFNQWYINKEYPVKLSGPFLQTLAEIWSVNLPRTKTGAYSFTEKALATLGDCDLTQVLAGKRRLTETEIKAVQAKLHADSGQVYMFNIQSKDHLKRLFFTKLKEKPLSTTDLGNPQVTEEFLELMGAKYPWAKELITYNKLVKIKSTYVERFLEKQENGMFYPSFFMHRTVSGRLGSDFQQMPRPLEPGQVEDVVIKYNNRIRAFFIAGEGRSFVDDDYESLEPHVFAHVSGDPGLINIFEQNQDFYSTIAIATEGLKNVSADKKADNYLGKVNKLARQKAKAYSLGIAYGMGGYKLAFELDIPQNQAEQLVTNYLNAYPNLKKWMIESKEFALKNGYIKTETGRVRRFEELKYAYAKYGPTLLDSLELWKEYHETPATYAKMKELAGKCKNYINNSYNVQIQGLAASIMNKACIAVARQLKGTEAYVCAQIHDELVVNCPDNMVPEVCKIVQDCMENSYKLSLKLKAVPSVGKNLRDAKG